uniref:Kazal-like domain-containing protein n=1 Tax=Populus davidiana TaxID=266767 RepID=A0A6M2F5G3_9ROSI
MIYQLPFPKKKKMMMMPSTLLIHFLLITSIALFSAPTVRSDANPIRLPTLDHNNDDDDACGEWSRRSPVSFCPVKCFRPDPVCGVDGVTYWCGCDDARCAGTKVTKKGFCEVGNNGAAAQALLLVHIVWLIVLGFSILFGLF